MLSVVTLSVATEMLVILLVVILDVVTLSIATEKVVMLLILSVVILPVSNHFLSLLASSSNLFKDFGQ